MDPSDSSIPIKILSKIGLSSQIITIIIVFKTQNNT